MKEQTIQSKIIKHLEGKGAYVVKVTSANKAGVPDVLACLDGKFIGVEVKNETGRPTELQLYNIRRIISAGGVAGVCRSVADVEKLISEA